jgi:ABC-type glycerol-3-phosphate transport system substrate-binding protein
VVPSISTADVLPADPFLAGRIGIVLIGTWRNSSLFQNYEATRGNPGQADFRWGVAPLPKQKHRATIYFGGGPVIYSGTRRAREAWEVLKFYTSDEWQEAVAKRGRGVPAKMEIAERVFLKLPAIPEGEDFSVILRSLEYARPQPSGREVAEIMEGSLRMLCDNVAAGRVPDIRAEILRMQREYDDPNPYNPLVREARTKK